MCVIKGCDTVIGCTLCVRERKDHTGEIGQFQLSRTIINLFFNKIITQKRWSELLNIDKVSEILLLEAKFLCKEREVCTKIKEQAGRALPSAEINSYGITKFFREKTGG